jgi:hypothetical protein
VRELSLFADESGDSSNQSMYYLLTLVFHDQTYSIDDHISRHEQALQDAGLPDVPFHMSPLLNGHEDYRNLEVETRAYLLKRFFAFVRSVPISYKTFVFPKKEVPPEKLLAKMRQDMINYLFDNLSYLQQFNAVKAYYDRGQKLITNNLTTALDYVLAGNVSVFKDGDPSHYRLAQAADLICGLELEARKFETNSQTATDIRFFGSLAELRKDYLRQLRKKQL